MYVEIMILLCTLLLWILLQFLLSASKHKLVLLFVVETHVQRCHSFLGTTFVNLVWCLPGPHKMFPDMLEIVQVICTIKLLYSNKRLVFLCKCLIVCMIFIYYHAQCDVRGSILEITPPLTFLAFSFLSINSCGKGNLIVGIFLSFKL